MTATTDEGLAYSVRTAAKLADCSESSIRRAISEGHLKAVTPKGSSLLRITHAALDAWVKGE